MWLDIQEFKEKNLDKNIIENRNGYCAIFLRNIRCSSSKRGAK